MENQETIIIAAVAFVSVTTWLCLLGGLAAWLHHVLQQRPKTAANKQGKPGTVHTKTGQFKLHQLKDKLAAKRNGSVVLPIYRNDKSGVYATTWWRTPDASTLYRATRVPEEFLCAPGAIVAACDWVLDQGDLGDEDTNDLVLIRDVLKQPAAELTARYQTRQKQQQANGADYTDVSVDLS